MTKGNKNSRTLQGHSCYIEFGIIDCIIRVISVLLLGIGVQTDDQGEWFLNRLRNVGQYVQVL
jgi:hypothetical protein